MEEIEERLEAYISRLKVSDRTKGKVRHDVKEFISVLKERGRTWPGTDEDYTAYWQKMKTAKISEDTIKEALSRVRRFSEYLSEKHTDEEGSQRDFSEPREVIAPVQEPVIEPVADEAIDRPDEAAETGSETKTRRFSLLIHPSMYESLEWLSQYDRCSVARVILNACAEYTAQRRDDIDFITEQMSILKRGIEQRKAAKG